MLGQAAARVLVPVSLALAACEAGGGSSPASRQPDGTGTLNIEGAALDLRVLSCRGDGEESFSLRAVVDEDDSGSSSLTIDRSWSHDGGIEDRVEIVGVGGGLPFTLEASESGSRLFDADSDGVRASRITVSAGSRADDEFQVAISASCP